MSEQWFIADCDYGDLIEFANNVLHKDKGYNELMYTDIEIHTNDKHDPKRGFFHVATIMVEVEGYKIEIIDKEYLDSKET